MERNEIIIDYSRDILAMTKALMAEVDIESELPNKNAKIILKPNLVVATTPDSGATTHIEIISGIIEFLQSKGYRNITIAEGSWVGDSTLRAFKVNNYMQFTKKYGVPLLDLKGDDYVTVNSHGVKMEISQTAMECDYLISLPVLKGHCQTAMTCALKNMKGILSDRSKRLFHSLGLHKPIAALNAVKCADLVVVDSICGDLDFEEGGNPVEANRMIVAKDSVLLDTYAMLMLGYSFDDVPYISLAEEYGVGYTDIKHARIRELHAPESVTGAQPTGQARQLARFTDQRSACSACYASLIHALKRLDQEGMLGLVRGKKICIGQEFQGHEMDIGVGKCCAGAKHGAKGCPPTASAIFNMLQEL
ncbi:MAG: DUF362 domain-containing protein [Spirochaetales bacterium]|nr:DUF362 domain-containing protein [Spirochaetales bacterium]